MDLGELNWRAGAPQCLDGPRHERYEYKRDGQPDEDRGESGNPPGHVL